MGKTRYAPSTQRFADVPHEPCVYVAEFSNGVIKVGVGGSARARLMALANQVKRECATEILRFHVVTKPTTKAAFEAETVIVHLLSQVAELVPGRREHFTGITFEFARDLAGSVSGVPYRPGRASPVKPVFGIRHAVPAEAA